MASDASIEPTPVEIAVIGRGMIGSAAARHLAEAGHRVVAIGPDEPGDWSSWTGPFSSHGDEGRITRITDRDPVWAAAARRSIERYADIEERSGIRFHQPCGLAISTGDLDTWLTTSREAGAAVEERTADRLAADTGITLAPGTPAAFEGPPAGLINPRRLVRAQNELARRAGASIVAEPATSLSVSGDGVEVGGSWGAVRADRALVATGAFGHDLIGRRLEVVRRPRTVLLVELSAGSTGPDPADLPSLILRPPPDARLETLYWVPPVPYPDGRTYLKVGGTLRPDPLIGAGGDHELVEWFHGSGDPVELDALRTCVEQLLPTMTIGATAGIPCVYTGTPSGYPIIDWVDDRVAVAIGGNGSAAKSSDELGRLGASLVTGGELAAPTTREVFAAAVG